MIRWIFVTGLVLVTNTGAPMSTHVTPAGMLQRLHSGHPRLLATAADFDRLKQRVGTNPQLRDWQAALQKRAASVLTAPPSRYEIPDGKRLLATSRQVLDRVYTLAMLYRLDGDRQYADRAWQELAAAAAFKDWNPNHFLDTAEMTHAFAIGYDWLYDVWTPTQRATLRQAIIEKGLRPARACYRGEAGYGWWTKAHHNWNQVCNGGIGMGALAVGDEAPELAAEILLGAVKSLPLAMASFAPDGAWAEGPTYWDYATRYNVAFLAALESALGTDFGLSAAPGFARTGLYPLYLTGPTGIPFNFADAGKVTLTRPNLGYGPNRSPQQFWFARKFNLPACAFVQRRHAQPHALDLLWYDDRGDAGLPLDRYFRTAEVATFRSAWDDPQAVFVGFKAGDNKANHGHLDLGTFVLDALGQRWAADLGSDNYNLPGFFGAKRWEYYRLRAEGHNTLVLNPGPGPDQDPKAHAKITRFESQPDRAFAIADLSPAYPGQVRRGLALLDRRHVLVQDEIRTDQPVELWWFLHTPAAMAISADGRTATLTQAGKSFPVRLLLPAAARFTEMPTQPLPTSPHPPGQADNTGIRTLAIHLTGVTDTRLVVALATTNTTAPIVPLADW
jgi:hypothetical protein